jgi:hypothetical protein
MRSDMKKVVTERPRGGGRFKTPKGENRQRQSYPQDEQPHLEKIRAKWIRGGGAKHFTDVLGPLYRYLVKQVGRKWDAVYSEIARNLPKISVQNRHVYTHIWQFIERDIQIINGEVCYKGNCVDGIPIRSSGRYTRLFVHPQTGLLCKAKKGKTPWEYRQGTLDACEPGIKVYPGCQYHKLRGIWYEVEVRRFPPLRDVHGLRINSGVNDEVLGRFYGDWEQLRRVYGGDYIAVSKRRLKKREIRFANLK